MKKIILSTLLLPYYTYAVTVGDFKNVDVIKKTPVVEEVIVNIINFILKFSAALAVLFIIIGGVMYITSSGNDEKVKSAKKILTSAVIGLVIIISAIVIINVVTSTTDKII